MAFPIQALLDENLPAEEALELLAVCTANGLEQAIDLAMIEEDWHGELLAGSLHLKTQLEACVAKARTYARGWAVGANTAAQRAADAVSGDRGSVGAAALRVSHGLALHETATARAQPPLN